jgi:opacity protein-like surface antigen
MRNTLFFLFFSLSILFSPKPALAQDAKQGNRFRAGLTFGAVATDIPGMDTRDKDSDFSKLGFSFGAIINTRVSEKNTMQLEINYVMKGSMQRPDSNNMGYFKMNLNYIEVPLIFRHTIRMNIHRKPVDRLEVEGGFSVGRLVTYSFTDESNYQQVVDVNALNFTDVSVLGGLSFNFTPNIYFTIRYSNSVIPSIKRNKIDPAFVRYTWNNGNNQVVLMSVKYVFGKPRPIAAKANTPPPPAAE